MLGRTIAGSLVVLAALVASTELAPRTAHAAEGQPTDWGRFYYYPYVYYPHNFQRPVEYDHMYYRYPQERRIPVYRRDWINFYPSKRPYHRGHHFVLDVF